MSSKYLSLEEIELYSNNIKLDLSSIPGRYWYTRDDIGVYTYLRQVYSPRNQEYGMTIGKYSYSIPPDGGYEGGAVDVPFSRGVLTDGLTGQGDAHSVYWKNPGNRSITFELGEDVYLNGLVAVYQGDRDRCINKGVWHSSGDGANWTYVGAWIDDCLYNISQEIARVVRINDTTRFLRLDVESNMSITKLNEVEFLSLHTESFTLGELTDGSYESSLYFNSGSHSIIFDFKKEHSLTELLAVYYGDRDKNVYRGSWYVSGDGVNWVEVGGWIDDGFYETRQKIVKSIVVNVTAKYARLDLFGNKSLIQLSEVEFISQSGPIGLKGVAPNVWTDAGINYKRGGFIPFGSGDLTNGIDDGLRDCSGVIWDESYTGPVDIVFDLGGNFSLDEIRVVARFRDEKYGLPETNVSVSLDGMNYMSVGVVSQRTYAEV